MSQHTTANTPRLFSISGTFGEAQIAANRSRVLIDLQTRNHDAGGMRRRHHALANLPLETASEFRDLLNQAIAVAAEARLLQSDLWSGAGQPVGCGAAHDANPPVEHVSATASRRLPFPYQHRMPKMRAKSPTIRFAISLGSKLSWRVTFFVD